MSFHGLLDWRLGLSLLRVLRDETYNCALVGGFSEPEIQDWPSVARRLRDSFCRTFSCAPLECGELSGFEVGGRRVLIIHPLWSTHRPTGRLAQAIASLPGDRPVQFVDTFNLRRRMSWVYQGLAT